MTTKLWDTETGQCIKNFSTGKIAYCCSFYQPDNNLFLVGMANKRIVQFDARTDDIVQEYVSSLRFITTSHHKWW